MSPEPSSRPDSSPEPEPRVPLEPGSGSGSDAPTQHFQHRADPGATQAEDAASTPGPGNSLQGDFFVSTGSSGSSRSGGTEQTAGSPAQLSFGEYELLEEIARGGMGVVYRARQPKLNRLVAVKMILAGRFAGEKDVQRFYTEAEAAAHLRHPNIVGIYEIGEHGGHHFYSMEYVEGQSLAQLMRGGSLPLERSLRYLHTLAEAIAYVHEQGTLHRDLKPSNVMIDQQDRVRVTDFGLAKRLDSGSDLTASGSVLGTASYMPPEQASGKRDRIGPAVDIYAMGAILYELATGQPPFKGETTVETLWKVLHEDVLPPSSLVPALDPRIEAIVMKCLAHRPEDRYRTARELAHDLARCRAGEAVSAPHVVPDRGPRSAPAGSRPPRRPVPPSASGSASSIAARHGSSVYEDEATAERGKVTAWFGIGTGVLSLLFALTLARVPCLGLTMLLPFAAVPVILGLISRNSAHSSPQARKHGMIGLYCGLSSLMVGLMMQCIGCQSGVEQMIDSGQQFIAREQQWSELIQRLRPIPSDAGMAELFPDRVGEFRRAAADREASIDWLGIDASGYHASYQQGSQQVEFYAWPVSNLEREALMRRIKIGIDESSYLSKFTSGLGDETSPGSKPIFGSRASFEVGPPTDEGTFFWNRGWLFLSNTDGTVDADMFLRNYLRALNAGATPVKQLPAEAPLEAESPDVAIPAASE